MLAGLPVIEYAKASYFIFTIDSLRYYLPAISMIISLNQLKVRALIFNYCSFDEQK